MYDYEKLQETIDNMKHNIYNWGDFAQEVIEWNCVAGNGKHDFSQEKLILQRKLIEEEFKEFIEAIASGKERDIVKEAVDIIVVASYYDFLAMNILNGSTEFPHYPHTMLNLSSYDFASLEALKGYVEDLGDEVGFIVARTVAYLLITMHFDSTIADGILGANWSKFPYVKDFKEKIVHMNAMMDNYDECPQEAPLEECFLYQVSVLDTVNKGRYTGYRYEVVPSEGGDRLVIKCDTGKIMKPCTFRPMV